MSNTINAKGYLTSSAATINGMLSNPAPAGTKLFLLDLGTLECDSGFLLKGGNTSTRSNPNPGHERRKLAMFSILIDIPVVGCVLFDLGPGPGVTGNDEQDYEKVWGGVADVFCRVLPSPDNELPVALGKIGYKLEDIKHVIISHLHLDHAGGLLFFKGRDDVSFWVSETELKHAAWAIGTGHELGAYLPHYFDLGLNWKTVNGERVDIFPGITLLSLPGHTPGLQGMQVTLPNDGVMIFTGDHIHIKENYINEHIQGWLATDSISWYRSTQTLKMLQRATNARIVFGHDFDTTRAMYEEKPFFE